MAIDEKKAILRGLAATAQQMRAEAASPEVVARVEAVRRQADRRYQMLCGPLLMLPVAMALLATCWQEYRFYTFGWHWGSEVTFGRYWRESVMMIGAGLVLCGVGFAFLWMFREVAGKRMRIASLVGNIVAGVLPIFGVFLLHYFFATGRQAAYASLNYAQLVAAAPDIERIRQTEGVAIGMAIDESSAQWKRVPKYLQDIAPQRLIVLDHGFALDLDSSGMAGEYEGLVVPQSMSDSVAQERARKYAMEVVSTTPPVLRFKDSIAEGSWLNGVLDGTASPGAGISMP